MPGTWTTRTSPDWRRRSGAIPDAAARSACLSGKPTAIRVRIATTKRKSSGGNCCLRRRSRRLHKVFSTCHTAWMRKAKTAAGIGRRDDQWRLTLTARQTSWSHDGYQDGPGIKISADAVMRQAEAALWLLAHYGGVGSKSRKGFGSFADIAVEDISGLEDCMATGAALREHCGLKTAAGTGTPALEHRIGPVEVETQWRDAWNTLDRVGDVYQSFAKGLKGHEREKRMALGLPRKDLQHPAYGRYASPALWSLTRRGDRYSVRLLCFPSDLPDPKTSHKILKDLSEQAKKLEAASRTGAGRKSPRKPLPPRKRVSSEKLATGQGGTAGGEDKQRRLEGEGDRHRHRRAHPQ